MKDERFEKLINLVKEKNLKFDIALIFGKMEIAREIIIKLLEENKVEIIKNVEKIIETERKFRTLYLLLDISSPLTFQVGKEILDKARKVKVFFEIYFNEFLYSLLDENVEKINESVEKINSLKEEIENSINEILEKIR